MNKPKPDPEVVAKLRLNPEALTAAGAQPEASVDPEPGARLHHYEIIKRLGRGGMGAVFLARDTRLGRKVAIKVLRTPSAEVTRRFILEARAIAACTHENLVTIHEVDAWQGSPFMVCEHLVGHTLTTLLPEDRPLPAPRVVELLVPVVRALARAHGQGLVHRDLKPDNVFVCDSGAIKVLDFGIAQALRSDEHATAIVSGAQAALEDDDESPEALAQKHALQTTLAHLAPEQWGLGAPPDHRADLWAVGIMLFRMLSGKHPLDPLHGHQLMVTGMLDTPMPLLSDRPHSDVPRELATIVDRCLMKRREQRWPDAVTLLRALEPYLPGNFSRKLEPEECPYPGLAPFQERDAGRFFGRAPEIAATVNRVRERPLIAIAGAAGAGKSSFVRAGLIPALKRSGEHWEALVMRPGRAPLAALASLIAPMVEAAVPQQLTQRLFIEPGFAGTVLRARARHEKRNLLLFIDQFEELYTLAKDPAERRAFTAALSAAADDPTSPVRLVVSIRSDFLDRAPEDPQFVADLVQGLVFLSAPGADALREALTAPAALAGYRFASPHLLDEMVAQLQSTHGALPLLQVAATRLWDSRDVMHKLLTTEAHESIGEVTGALASHADQVLGTFDALAAQLARTIFLRLITPERTRAIVSLDELRELHPDPAQLQTVLDELLQARLLTTQTGPAGATVELVHEALIDGWPTLKRWLEASGEDEAFVIEVRNAARAWHGKNRPQDLLWRGELAEDAERFASRYRGPLNDLQRAFLDAVVSLKGLHARQRMRRMQLGLAAALVMAIASGIVMFVVRQARDEAQAQAVAAREAESAARQKQEEAEANEKERVKAAAEAEAAREALIKALAESEAARKKALEAEGRAGQNVNAARTAADAARLREHLARQALEALEKERARLREVEAKSRSSAIDTLK